MIAMTDGATSAFVQQQSTILQAEFEQEIDSGLLEVIVPPAAFYPPDLNRIPPTFNDPPQRMLWRTKQTLDYAYLMMYCQRRGIYYMQLEDDVITKSNYLSKIKGFIVQQTSSTTGQSDWLLLEFSSLGFIGKLFRAGDLPWIVQFLLIFYRQKPVDWILNDLFHARYCSPEKSVKLCEQIKKKYRVRSKPSLFQHIGVHSSLKGKVQKLKEKDFGKAVLYKAHSDNPPANVSTSLKIYQKYSLANAYAGTNFFWALLPQANDWIRFDFQPPVRLESFLFRSGNSEHLDDKFFNTSVEILTLEGAPPPVVVQGDDATTPVTTKDGYRVVGAFNEAGTAHATLNTSAAVVSLRLVVHVESHTWAILNEIHIKALPT